MQTFSQYIISEGRTEIMAKIFKGGSSTTEFSKGLENPSSVRELEGFVKRTDYDEARFIIHKKTNRMLVWGSHEFLHWEVIGAEEGKSTAYMDGIYVLGVIRIMAVLGKSAWTLESHQNFMPPATVKKILKKNKVLVQIINLPTTTFMLEGERVESL